MRRRFYLPPETTAVSILVTPARDVGDRSMLAVWKFDGRDTSDLGLHGLAWSNAVDGWFHYVSATGAGTPTPGPWINVPAMDSVLIDLRNWPDRSNVPTDAIVSLTMVARVRGSAMVASTLGEAV